MDELDTETTIIGVILLALGTFGALLLIVLYRAWALWYIWNQIATWHLSFAAGVVVSLTTGLIWKPSFTKDDRPTDWAGIAIALIWPLLCVGAAWMLL